MERDEPRGYNPPANDPAEPGHEGNDEHREEHIDGVVHSGYTTTKQAAKVLGVSRRTVQSYVRRGDLEAVVEGDGVEKTFFVSIDSLNALRDRRRRSDEGSQRVAEGASCVSAGSGGMTNAAKEVGEPTPDLIEIVQDLQYRLGRAEAQVELTARTESTLREQLVREQERADRLEAELREARQAPPVQSGNSEIASAETASEDTSGGDVRQGDQETQERRSWLYRFFFGP